MGKEESNQRPVRPKSIFIEVAEGGKRQPDVRIPFFMVKAGMKIGQALHSQKAKGGNELDLLKDIDIDAIVSSIGKGELTLPCLLAEVDDSENDKHVKITLE